MERISKFCIELTLEMTLNYLKRTDTPSDFNVPVHDLSLFEIHSLQ